MSSLPDQFGPRLLPRRKPEYSSPLRIWKKIDKHNCTLGDKNRTSDICMAEIDTKCGNEAVALSDVDLYDMCYSVTRTICTIVTESVMTKKCKYHYQYR